MVDKMTTVSVKKELLEELVDSRLKVITRKINNILKKWKYNSVELFLTQAADGTLEEAEPDALSLTNLLEKQKELYRLKTSPNKTANRIDEIVYDNTPRSRENFNLLNKEIDESKQRILSLKDNWDKEGSKGYKEEIWNRSISFLRQLYQKLYGEYKIEIAIPDILPGPEGSIDIHWKTEKYELLINIPSDLNEPASFYGDNYSNLKIQGTFELKQLNIMLIDWLKTNNEL